MSCKQDKMLLSGSAEFTECDIAGDIVNNWNIKNSITTVGKNAYSAILTNMMKIDYPLNETFNTSQQSSILSNYMQFGSQSGDVNFLSPCNIDKHLITKHSVYQGKPCVGYGHSSVRYPSQMLKLSLGSGRIVNGDACFDNSDANVTVFKNYVKDNNVSGSTSEFQELKRFYYVYNVGSNLLNDEKYTGIRVDFGGIPTKKNYFRIAFNYADSDCFEYSSTSSGTASTITHYWLQQSKINTTFPLLNGKPTYKQRGSFYGGRFTNDQTNSYFFDMYPRYFKMPKQIIFIFDAGGVNESATSESYSNLNIQKNDVVVNNVQFFKHRQPKHSAMGIYLKGKDNQGNEIYYFKKIMRVFHKTVTEENKTKNYLCYYTKIDYNQANRLSVVDSCGLCNRKNIFQYKPQYQLNKLYSLQTKQVYDSNKNDTNYQYFFRKEYKQFVGNDNSNNYNLLTQLQLDTPWYKSENKRLDILYKIQVNFSGEETV